MEYRYTYKTIHNEILPIADEEMITFDTLGQRKNRIT